MFFADDKFSKYKKAEFALWTESCAGSPRDHQRTAPLTRCDIAMEATMALQLLRKLD